MKHVHDTTAWQFTREPFPAFRCELIFGRNKHDKAFLPVKDVEVGEDGLLPEGQFKIIKTREKGTILIVPGADTTNRLLVFTSIAGGFRGACGLLRADTTATILAIAAAANNCSSATAVAAILDDGQALSFESYGRRTNDVIVMSAIAGELTRRCYTAAEWKARHADTESAEEL